MPESRIECVRSHLEAHRADGALISFLPDIRWCSGFTGSNGLLLVFKGEVHFISDGRYRNQAEREIFGAEIHITGDPLLDYVSRANTVKPDSSILFQSDHTSFESYQKMSSLFPGVRWLPAAGLLERDVARKSSSEIDLVSNAQRISDDVFERLLEKIKPGMTEREIAAEIVYEHLRRGAEKMSFDPIVASGSNGALPHAKPGLKKVEHGEMIVLDFGCFYNGYASDMTRTIALGEPGDEARKVYDIVRKAQENALEHARAGIPANTLDHSARSVIEASDYGDYFTHSLGHGVGLQIHEWPRIAKNTHDILPEGSIVTIEPGVYLPGRFGIRIEDMVVLREDGNVNLTRSPKELICI